MLFRILFFVILAQGLQAQKTDSFTVYYFLGEECKICQYYSLTFNELHDTFASDSIQFVGLFPNHFSTEEGIDKFKSDYKIPFVLKREYFQTKTQKFEVKITPTVVVYNETEERVVYKGRIDDSYYKLGRRRRVITSEELKDVLTSIRNGEAVTTKPIEPIGCVITYK